MAEENLPRGVDPRSVISPQRSIAKDSISVIYDGGAYNGDDWTGWSLVRLNWDGNPDAVGIRWNGEEGKSLGMPNSYGRPTWFIIPQPIAEIVVNAVNNYMAGQDMYRPHRLRRCVNDLLAAARAANSEELSKLQLYM